MVNETDICRNEADSEIMGDYPGQFGREKLLEC